jgi:hypothetical protein
MQCIERAAKKYQTSGERAEMLSGTNTHVIYKIQIVLEANLSCAKVGYQFDSTHEN